MNAKNSRVCAGATASRAGKGDPGKSSRLLRQGDRPNPVAVFGFVERERANYPVATMCRVLEVSTSGYYAWRSRPASPRSLADACLAQVICEIHTDSRGTYGAPRIHAELRLDHRIFCSQKRVARLMHQAGIQVAFTGARGSARLDVMRRRLLFPTSWSGTFRPPSPTGSGSQTSPTCRPGQDSSTSRW
jgi:hypothetical protein